MNAYELAEYIMEGDNQAITGASACAVMLVAQAKLIEQLEEKLKSAEVLK
jgi:hypothetical protein